MLAAAIPARHWRVEALNAVTPRHLHHRIVVSVGKCDVRKGTANTGRASQRRRPRRRVELSGIEAHKAADSPVPRCSPLAVPSIRLLDARGVFVPPCLRAAVEGVDGGVAGDMAIYRLDLVALFLLGLLGLVLFGRLSPLAKCREDGHVGIEPLEGICRYRRCRPGWSRGGEEKCCCWGMESQSRQAVARQQRLLNRPEPAGRQIRWLPDQFAFDFWGDVAVPVQLWAKPLNPGPNLAEPPSVEATSPRSTTVTLSRDRWNVIQTRTAIDTEAGNWWRG